VLSANNLPGQLLDTYLVTYFDCLRFILRHFVLTSLFSFSLSLSFFLFQSIVVLSKNSVSYIPDKVNNNNLNTNIVMSHPSCLVPPACKDHNPVTKLTKPVYFLTDFMCET